MHELYIMEVMEQTMADGPGSAPPFIVPDANIIAPDATTRSPGNSRTVTR